MRGRRSEAERSAALHLAGVRGRGSRLCARKLCCRTNLMARSASSTLGAPAGERCPNLSLSLAQGTHSTQLSLSFALRSYRRDPIMTSDGCGDQPSRRAGVEKAYHVPPHPIPAHDARPRPRGCAARASARHAAPGTFSLRTPPHGPDTGPMMPLLADAARWGKPSERSFELKAAKGQRRLRVHAACTSSAQTPKRSAKRRALHVSIRRDGDLPDRTLCQGSAAAGALSLE